jgi:type IV pilus assembly protein PilA
MKKEVMKNNKGFSLVELIVVIAIMAVLMAVLAPALLRYVEKSRIQSDDSTAAEVKNAVEIALSDDAIYDALDGTATVTVKYAADGTISVTNDTTGGDVLNELKTTLKASSESKISAVKSKQYSGKSYVVTAKYESTKGTYEITGDWQ